MDNKNNNQIPKDIDDYISQNINIYNNINKYYYHNYLDLLSYNNDNEKQKRQIINNMNINMNYNNININNNKNNSDVNNILNNNKKIIKENSQSIDKKLNKYKNNLDKNADKSNNYKNYNKNMNEILNYNNNYNDIKDK